METKQSHPSCNVNAYYFYDYKFHMRKVMISIKWLIKMEYIGNFFICCRLVKCSKSVFTSFCHTLPKLIWKATLPIHPILVYPGCWLLPQLSYRILASWKTHPVDHTCGSYLLFPSTDSIYEKPHVIHLCYLTYPQPYLLHWTSSTAPVCKTDVQLLYLR